MNPIIKKHAIKFGVISALIGIVYSIIAYVFDETLFVNWWFGIAIIVVSLVILGISISSVKKEQGGFISFKEAFSTFVITWVISAVLSTSFNFILFNLIDPDFQERITELTIEKTAGFMERMGTPEETIDEAIKGIEEQDNYSIGGLLRGFVYSTLFMSVIGLIYAAVMKKNKPIFEE